jgi:hypothetical protein
MEDINWNIVGDNKVHMKFTIPINPRKKWWEFWKKDEPKQAVKEKLENNTILSSIFVHPHPIIEMRVGEIKKDESGYYAHCTLYNCERKEIESGFLLDEDRAKEIIGLMEKFLDNLH